MQSLSWEVSETKTSERLLIHMNIVSLMPAFVFDMQVSQGNGPIVSTT